MRQIKAGTTDVSVVIRIIDSTDGTPETGVVFNTSGIDLEYRREGAASVDITEATLAALTTAHTDGGFLHIGNGYYRLDLPDAAVAAGATGVLVHGVVTGMVVLGEYIELVAYDPYDTVRLGLTALPNVASGSAGAVITSGTGTAQLSVGSGLVTLAAVTHTGATIPTVTTTTTATNVTTVNGLAANVITAAATAADFGAEIADAIWDEVLSGHLTVGTAGQRMAFPRANTAQAGAASTITLDASASAVDDFYNNDLIYISAGTGALQARIISDYVGSTKVATVSANWATNPSSDSVFIILPGGATTLTGTVDANVVSMAANTLTAAATAADFGAEVADAVWDEALAGHTTPGSAGETLGNVATGTPPTAAAIADAVWDEAQADHVSAGSFGEVATETAAILVDTGTTLQGELDAIQANVDAILVDTGTTLQAELDGIQADTEDLQTRLPAALIGGRIDATVDATGMEAGAVDAILDELIGDSTITMRQALKLLVATLGGKLSGAATTTVTIRNAADDTNRVVATVDADGNRSAVTLSL